MGRLFRLLPLLVLCACSTLKGRANELARQGRFVEAAELYGELVRKHPRDESLVPVRNELRWRAMEQLLGQARRYRMEGRDDEAEHELERFLRHRARWAVKLNGALESSLLEEIEGTHLHCRRIIGEPARRGGALTAEHALLHKRPLLVHAEMAVVLREMEQVVLESGRRTCAGLKQVPAEDSPHWSELVVRYCQHWGESAPLAPPPPEVFGVPVLSGEVEGMRAEQLEFVKGRLARVFEDSPWYSPRASRYASFTLQGHFRATFERTPVWLSAPWTDREPYTDHEERTEEYQEPYTEEEKYTDEHGNEQTRTVTRYRTKQRGYTVAVTRYRDVPKSFEYQALSHSAAYRFSVTAMGGLDARRSPLTVAFTDTFQEQAYEHDVSFDPAGVSPQRASLTQAHVWFEQKVQGLARSFAAQLLAHWRESHCSGPMLTLEEAARCARAGAGLPGPAGQRLATVLGEDAWRVHALFARTLPPLELVSARRD
jgi:hypothetical protein